MLRKVSGQFLMLLGSKSANRHFSHNWRQHDTLDRLHVGFPGPGISRVMPCALQPFPTPKSAIAKQLLTLRKRTGKSDDEADRAATSGTSTL